MHYVHDVLCTRTCRAARVLVMTDETFRQKFQYVLDHRVQAGALLSMVLQMLIVPGMPCHYYIVRVN
jgi:hypothetical protein